SRCARAPTSCGSTTAARCRRCAWREGSVAKSLLETPWSVAIDPARRDGRIVAESSETDRPARPVAMPRSLDPGLVEALGRTGIERLYSHQRDALRAAAESN